MKRPYLKRHPAAVLDDGHLIRARWMVTWDPPNPHWRLWIPLRDVRRWLRAR